MAASRNLDTVTSAVGGRARTPALLLGSVTIMGCASLRQASAAPALSATADSASAHDAAVRFIGAFDSLRWDAFREMLAPDATVFLPSGESTRLEGAAAFASFERLFDDVRKDRVQRGAPDPPYLGIAARLRDLRVQSQGGLAVVTFHLGSGPTPARRTLVFRYAAAPRRWQLLHLHGSAAAPAPTR